MWYKSKLILSALVMLLITTGCDKRPENVLDDSEMVDLMTDLLLADALEQSSSMSQFPDSIRHDLGERILREHGLNRVTLDSTFSWYSRNIDDYYRLYAKVDKRLKKMRKSVGGNMPETENENNIWELPGYFKFTDFAAGDAMTFALPGEKVEKGEELKWRLFSEENVSLDLLIGIDYEDGTSSFTRRETHGGHTELTVVADTALKASRIYGFIWAERTGRSIWIDSIALVKAPFDSLTYSNQRFKRKITPPRKKEVKPDSAINETFVKDRRLKESPALRETN